MPAKEGKLKEVSDLVTQNNLTQDIKTANFPDKYLHVKKALLRLLNPWNFQKANIYNDCSVILIE